MANYGHVAIEKEPIVIEVQGLPGARESKTESRREEALKTSAVAKALADRQGLESRLACNPSESRISAKGVRGMIVRGIIMKSILSSIPLTIIPLTLPADSLSPVAVSRT